MCGIAGYSGPGLPGVLEQMTARVSHRGPDGRAFWCDPTGQVHFGHSRLAIIDRAGGAQPMSTSNGGLTVVFNGEIYNAPELRSHLMVRGHRFLTDHSDTETLLHGYREWGAQLPEKLNGMWAFVIHDRDRNQLFASRDRFGEKPLYYAQCGGTLLFGSELGALRAHPDCPTGVNRCTLQKYFAYGFIPSPLTLLQGVHRLPGGHSFIYEIATGKLSLHRYWQFLLEPVEADGPGVEDRLAGELLERLRQAVKRQLVADVKVGVLLSGGIDSSAIAALTVAAHGRGQVASFNVGFKEPSFDESVPARAMAAHLGTVHHTAIVDLAAAERLLPVLQAGLDEPLGDPSILPTYALAGLARGQVGVALGGDGGDELFGGYDTFRALRFAEAYSACVPRPLHRAISHVCACLPVGHDNLSMDFKIKRFLRGLSHRAALWQPLWLSPLDGREWAGLFDAPVDLEEIFSEAIAAWDAVPQGNPVDRSLQFFTRLYLQDNILTKVDRASMLHGLEVRSPFLDLDVVDFARRLPSRWKLRGGCTKYLLKRALGEVLPAATIRRKKKGFGLPIGAWFKDGRLLPDNRDGVPGVNWYRVMAAESEHRAGRRDHRQLLWCAGMLEAWHRGLATR